MIIQFKYILTVSKVCWNFITASVMHRTCIFLSLFSGIVSGALYRRF